MKGERIKYTILESWPMLREDFEVFTKDPTCWFIDHFEKAASSRDWKSMDKLIEIFKIVNRQQEEHYH
jgi:hypothetical protein